MKRSQTFPFLLVTGSLLAFMTSCSDEVELDEPFDSINAFESRFDFESVGCDPSIPTETMLPLLLNVIDISSSGENLWLGKHDSLVSNQLSDGAAEIRLLIPGGELNINDLAIENCTSLNNSFDPDICVVGPDDTVPSGGQCSGFKGISGLVGPCFALDWDGNWDKNFISGGGKAFSLPVRTGKIAIQGDCIYAEGHGQTKDGKNAKVSLFDVTIKGRIQSSEFANGLYRANLESKFLNTRVGTQGDGGEWFIIRQKSFFD